jgi:putative Holliday junction resolvase
MALDIGERRIGVAISDPTGILARPLMTVLRASRLADFQTIAALVGEYAVDRIIVGLPLSLDGSEGPQARKTRRYADRMSEHIPVSMEFWDERYSSATAQEILKSKGDRRSSRAEIDAIAAAVILQSYLDSQAPLVDEQFY